MTGGLFRAAHGPRDEPQPAQALRRPLAGLVRPALFRTLRRTFGPAHAAGLAYPRLDAVSATSCCGCGGRSTCPPDEAHYWDWSRHLDWSYYSKGPLVAWLIRASCELFGPLSVAADGDLLAVRLPAVACHAALLAGWYVLAAGVFGRRGSGSAWSRPRLTLPIVAAARC